MEFLKKPHGQDTGMTIVAHNALRNDVLEVLLRQEDLLGGLGAQMAEMFGNRDENPVWRDYCIQYLADYYDRKWPADAPKAPDEERELLLSTYRVALSEREATVAGTALIGLESLSRRHSEVDRGEVAAQGVELASDDTCSPETRITALRVSAMLGRHDVAPAARVLAQTGRTTPLRMAALATLGDIGAKEDLDLLQAYCGSSDPSLKRIAEASLAKLRKSLNVGVSTDTAAVVEPVQQP
jgi:hypothetical protein